MKKNAKLAPSQTPLRQVDIFLHNADFPRLRVTKPPPNSPAERCCFTLIIGCARRMSLLEEIRWSQFLLGVVVEG